MPVRFLTILGFVLIAVGSVSQASANWFCDFCDDVARDIKRRQCWPDPFVYPDRVATRMPFATMVNNGWRRQNMLGKFHFEPNTGNLNEAGRRKVRWILVSGPAQHRFVYVHIADTNEETAARIAAVEQLAHKITPNDVPPVLSTSISDQGWPADQVDLIGRKFRSSTPDPRLPEISNTGSGMTSGE